jgi:diacylglycerol kinase family enzyme
LCAAGGDGTIRALAQQCAGKKVAFAVIPCGTFNFFARTHRIPENHEEAIRLALTGETRPVRLGEFNNMVFLINASLGLYVQVIRDREDRSSRWGRNRIVAILSLFLTLLRRQKPLRVDLVTGKDTQSIRTPMVFIGNNALQLRYLALKVAHCMQKDLLAVVLMKPSSRLEKLRIILRGIAKTLEKEENLDAFCADSLTIHTHRRFQTVALDGELFRMPSPLRVRALPGALQMVLPPKE